MFKMILKLLKYVNIVLFIVVSFSIIGFSLDYFFDNENQKIIEEKEFRANLNQQQIDTLKELIEERTKINQAIIDEAFMKDEDIALKIKDVLGEILDKELGLFRITNLNHKVDEKYINLYRTNLDIQYNQNKLFGFRDLERDIYKELDKKISNLNSKDESFEIKIGEFFFDDNSSTLRLVLLSKKLITTDLNYQ